MHKTGFLDANRSGDAGLTEIFLRSDTGCDYSSD